MRTSARYAVQYPSADRSDSADVPRDFASVVAGLEQSAMYGQGTLAARPNSTPGTPGIQGRFYMATDQNPMILYYDYGTGWVSVGAISAGGIGNVQLADGSVTSAKILDGTIATIDLADGSVTSAKIADGTIQAVDMSSGFFPSQGAGAGTEALRAIGSGAGQVVAGNDPRLTDQRTPLPNSIDGSKIIDGSITAADLAPGLISANSIGTGFPGSGLYSGYRYTLLAQSPSTGWVAWDFVYRPDLDGTFPWHCCGGAPINGTCADTTIRNGNGFNSGANAWYTGYLGMGGVPRAGWYDIVGGIRTSDGNGYPGHETWSGDFTAYFVRADNLSVISPSADFLHQNGYYANLYPVNYLHARCQINPATSVNLRLDIYLTGDSTVNCWGSHYMIAPVRLA